MELDRLYSIQEVGGELNPESINNIKAMIKRIKKEYEDYIKLVGDSLKAQLRRES